MNEKETVEKISNFLGRVNIPKEGQHVYKDECVYTFTTPESPEGIYVSLNNFFGFSKKYALKNYTKTKDPLYLHYRRVARPKKEDSSSTTTTTTTSDSDTHDDSHLKEPPKKRPTILGIGIEGGFEVDSIPRVEYDNIYSLVLLPDFITIPYPPSSNDAKIPEKINQSIAAIIAHEGAAKEAELGSWKLDDNDRKESKYAKDLKQLDNGVKIPPSGWKCDKCDLTSNLWLNLTDGKILCGRKQFGIEGNGHAMEHFNNTGYPISVKMGTITPEGADIYSYPEKDEVKDPHLEQHLKHFGINVFEMKKTEKTITEMNLDIQFSYDWNAIQEEGKDLKNLYGSGYTGMHNLGNTCYMNSVIQILFTFPEFKKRYFDIRNELFAESGGRNPADELDVQMAKLAHGLLSGKYSKKSESKETKEKKR